MDAGGPFDAVLDAALGGPDRPDVPHRGPDIGGNPTAAFAFHRPTRECRFGADIYVRHHDPGARPADPMRTRATRRLTHAQRRALHYLHELGSPELSVDCSARDLRQAFRRLAKRVHPDRHPGCDAGQAAHLARAFAVLCDAYRTLADAV